MNIAKSCVGPWSQNTRQPHTAGGRAVGQQEWRALHTHWRAPYFPYDHPYTPAGAVLAAARRAELAAVAAARPLGRARRPEDCSPLADWRGLGQAVREEGEEAAAAGVAAGAMGKGSGSRRAALLQLLPEDVRGHRPSRRGRRESEPAAVQVQGAGAAAAACDKPAIAAPSAAAADMHTSAASPAPAASPTDVAEVATAAAATAAAAAAVHDAAAALGSLPVSLHSPHSLRLALAPHLTRRAGVQQQQQQAGSGSSKGRSVGNSSGSSIKKDRLYGWTLRKALQQGLIPPTALAAPPLTVVAATAAAATAAAATAAGAAVGPPQEREAAERAAARRCLVHACVRVVGRGVCEAGAELLARLPTADTGSDTSGGPACGSGDGMEVDGGGSSGAAASGREEDQERVAQELGRGQDRTQEQQQQQAHIKHQQPQQQQRRRQALVRVGYVTSAAPRGSPSYPGGVAVCEAGCLAQAWAAQLLLLTPPRGTGRGGGGCGGEGRVRAQGLQPPLGREQAVEAWLRGGMEGSRATAVVTARGGGGGAGGGVLRLWLRNPASTALRDCVVQVAFGHC